MLFRSFFVIRYAWNYPWLVCVAATSFFFVIDVLFFASNLLKFLEGGWFPLAIGAIIYLLMRTWYDGRRLLNEALKVQSIRLEPFLTSIHNNPPARVEGVAVFLTSQMGVVPNAFLHNLKHNKVLHRYNLFVTVRNLELPVIDDASRLQIRRLDRKSTRLNSSHVSESRMPSSA